MPTENINIETQVQVDITRAALQALIAANTVKKKIYHITDAIGGTNKIAVFSLTTSTTSFNALNFTNGKFGKYYIGPDVFVAIVEGMGGVLSYNSFAVFPTTGLQNTVYIDLSTNEQYYWNGSSYELLSGGNVYEPTVDDFPTIGSADTLYVATTTSTMYLWNATAEEYQALNNTPYIPLSGTIAGSPVTGSIEMDASGGPITFYQTLGDYLKEITFYDDDRVSIKTTNNTTGYYYEISLGEGAVSFGSNDPNFSGAQYGADHSANFVDRSLVDKAYVDGLVGDYIPLAGTNTGQPVTGSVEIEKSIGFYSNDTFFLNELFFLDPTYGGDGILIRTTDLVALYQKEYLFSPNQELLLSVARIQDIKPKFWTKAGTPTTTDDVNAGYLVGSLIWDTTNSILYRCTSNTAGAATWVKAVPSLSDLWRHVITTDSTSFSGTTSETIVQSVLVPAGTFNGDWDVLVRARVRKTGTVGSTGMRFRINTSNSLAGAGTLGLLNAGSSNIYLQMKRDVIIKGSNTEVFSNTTNTATDDLNSNVGVSLLSINWAVDQYIMVTVTPTSTSDSYINSFLLVEGRKTLS